MDFNEYQQDALRTAFYHDSDNLGEEQGIHYTVLGLTGEAGEVAQLLKKFLRDAWTPDELRDRMIKELGDVLWYVAACASELDVSLNSIANRNLKKLRDRQERGALGGSGDQR